VTHICLLPHFLFSFLFPLFTLITCQFHTNTFHNHPTMSISTPDPSIAVKDLSYKFQDGSEGLEHVTLDLPAGSRTLLIGGTCLSLSPPPKKKQQIHPQSSNAPLFPKLLLMLIPMPTPMPMLMTIYSQRRRQNHPPPPPLRQTARAHTHHHSRRRRPLQRHPRRRNLPRRRMGA
jgi:hypothetical protein